MASLKDLIGSAPAVPEMERAPSGTEVNNTGKVTEKAVSTRAALVCGPGVPRVTTTLCSG